MKLDRIAGIIIIAALSIAATLAPPANAPSALWLDVRIGQIRHDRDPSLGAPRAMPLPAPTRHCTRSIHGQFDSASSRWYCVCPAVAASAEALASFVGPREAGAVALREGEAEQALAASCLLAGWHWMGQLPDPSEPCISPRVRNGWTAVDALPTQPRGCHWRSLTADDPRSGQ